MARAEFERIWGLQLLCWSLGLVACSASEQTSNNRVNNAALAQDVQCVGEHCATQSPAAQAASAQAVSLGNAGASAGGGSVAGSTGSAASASTFVASPPVVYVTKVKNLLMGTAPSDAEIQSSASSGTAGLKSLIGSWIQTPEYQAKMLTFFTMAFQQSQVQTTDLETAINSPDGFYWEWYNGPKMLASARESFARTALELINEGQPFTSTMTTQRFMMTLPLMMYYAYLDGYPVDDQGNLTNTIMTADPTFQFTVQYAAGSIPLSQSLQAGSANYMKFYDPAIATQTYFGCVDGVPQDPVTFSTTTAGDPARQLMIWMTGFKYQVNLINAPSCEPYMPNNWAQNVVPPSAFSQWQMVQIRQPNPGEATTHFYDIINMQAQPTLVLNTPRVGFFLPSLFSDNGRRTPATKRASQ